MSSQTNQFVDWGTLPSTPGYPLSRFDDRKIDLFHQISASLEPVLGVSFSKYIIGMISNKCTPEELIKLVPKIAQYFQSSEGKEYIVSNGETQVNQIKISVSELKRKEVFVSGAWLHQNKIFWGYAIKWKRKRWGWHVGLQSEEYSPGFQNESNRGVQSEEHHNDPDYIYQDMINYFADHCAIPASNISEIIPPPSGRGIGVINAINHRWRYVWENYCFIVVYREYDFTVDRAEIQNKPPVDTHCTKCQMKSIYSKWYNGYEGTIYNKLCENCYKIYTSQNSLRCNKCNEIEKYHKWDDGWVGQCYNGLCEFCTSNPRKEINDKIKLVEDKILLAERQFKQAGDEYESHLTSNSGEQRPIYNTKRFKDEPWYPEHCRLWTIQSHRQSSLSALRRRLSELLQGGTEKKLFFIQN